MAVYVDDMNANLGRMIMCHMMADTSIELLTMADRIGVPRRWIQYAGTASEHFDICKAKRAKAVKLGAQEITSRDMVLLVRSKRDARIHSAATLHPSETIQRQKAKHNEQ